MLKNISNLGTALNTEEQKTINGGVIYCPPCARVGALGCNLRNCLD
ncbi:hypothetical protein [uncultured Tenacibaculum sp.]|nr:hypothetical protein [uncultured Tenacibaculum sp.]